MLDEDPWRLWTPPPMTTQEIINYVGRTQRAGITSAQAEALRAALGDELPGRLHRMSGGQLNRLLARLGAGHTRWPPEGWPTVAEAAERWARMGIDPWATPGGRERCDPDLLDPPDYDEPPFLIRSPEYKLYKSYNAPEGNQ